MIQAVFSNPLHPEYGDVYKRQGRAVHRTGLPAPQRAVQARFLFPAAVLHPDDHKDK